MKRSPSSSTSKLQKELGDVEKRRTKQKKKVVLRLLNEPGYEEKSLFCTADTARDVLGRYGVAVIPGVLNEVECEQLEGEMWSYFGSLTREWSTPVSREVPESWCEVYKLLPMHSMLFQHFGIGHAQFAWNVRQNPKVAAPFAAIWNVKPEELLVSFDGASFHVPHETTKRGYFRGNTWYHTDQRFCGTAKGVSQETKANLKCVQGWVTARDVNEGDATLTVLKGSHLYHEEFASRFLGTASTAKGRAQGTPFKTDWYKLGSQEELDFFVKEKQCEPVRICCPRGSLVLWDSRTMHAGYESSKNRETPNFRMVVYVCYVPRSQATPKQLQKKLSALKELRTTSHWPQYSKLFGKTPRTYGTAEVPRVTPIEPPVLTEFGKKLAGF